MGTVQKRNELLFDSLSTSLRESKGVTEGNQWCASWLPQLGEGHPVPLPMPHVVTSHGYLKISHMVRALTPWKLVNATNQSFSFFFQ